MVVTGVAVVVEVGIRTMSLPRLASMLAVPLDTAPSQPSTPPARASDQTIFQLRTTRRVMRHWPWRGTCLRHALVLGNRLRRLEPSLRVGVARIDGVVKAHAWLEVDGRVLDPVGGARGYQVLEPVTAATS